MQASDSKPEGIAEATCSPFSRTDHHLHRDNAVSQWINLCRCLKTSPAGIDYVGARALKVPVVSVSWQNRDILEQMNTNEIVDILDSEIARLRQARNLLSEQGNVSSFAQVRNGFAPIAAQKRGRPAGSKNKTASIANERESLRRKSLSPEAKERIAAAQRKRWAKQKAAAKKVAHAATKLTSEKARSSDAPKSTVEEKKNPAASKTRTSIPANVVSAAKTSPKATKLVPAKKSPIAAKKATPASSSKTLKASAKSLSSPHSYKRQLPSRTSVAVHPSNNTSGASESTASAS